ncbi:MAG: hypothetical protein QOK40_1663, partial [Miltoncostaeaceae bacterium]|nr:hypothetical protein [Miltoncostaeaceae bacterium]
MLTNAVGPDKLGGLERYVRELSAALVRAGAAVTVLSKQVDPSHPTTEIGADGVRLIRHPVPPKSSPWFAARYPMSAVGPVLRAVRARPRAVVHAHFPTLALPLELTRRAFVYSFYAPVHRELLSERQGSYTLPLAAQPLAVAALRRAERRVTARATAIVVLSEYAREELAELCPAAATGAHVWPGGLDLDRFTPGPRRRDEWGAAA